MKFENPITFETFYCESCGRINLKQDETTTDNMGGIFCSKKCKTDFKKVMIENRKEIQSEARK